MQIQLKKIFSPDTIDLEHFVPENPDNFAILIQAMIGPKEIEGEESFDFVLCTQKWIEQELNKDKFIFGKGLLIVERYDFGFLHKILDDLCHRISGDDWRTIANKLSRYGNWEFEDYRES